MTGTNTGFIGYLYKFLQSKSIEKPMQFHCIVHQQSFCGKFLGFNSVMSTVISTVNFIHKSGLNHMQFKAFLQYIEAEYGNLFFHTEVQWLSRGNVLKRYFELKNEIDLFMNEKLKPVPELSNPAWL